MIRNSRIEMAKLLLLSHSSLYKLDKLEMGEHVPRISIGSLATFLSNKGVNVLVVQNNSIEYVKEKVLEFKPDYIGLTAYTFEICDAGLIAHEIKQISPGTKVIIGGCHVSAIPEKALNEFPDFDIGVIGEGEYVLLDVVSGKKLEDIHGIVYKTNGSIVTNPTRDRIRDLDSIPFPDWGKFFDLHCYKKKCGYLQLDVETARGCPYACSFCYRVAGRNVAYRDPIRVADHIETIVEKYSPDLVSFINGVFVFNKKKSYELLYEIKRRKIKVKMTAESRVNMLKDIDFVRMMKEANIVSTDIGIESGNDEILNKEGKGQNKADIIKAIDNCNKVKLPLSGNCIIGHPYETKETIKETIKFTRSLKLKSINFAIMVPFPGTQVRAMAEREEGGLKILSHDWRIYGKQSGNTMESRTLSSASLKKYQFLAYLIWYLNHPGKLFIMVKQNLNFALIRFFVSRIFGVFAR